MQTDSKSNTSAGTSSDEDAAGNGSAAFGAPGRDHDAKGGKQLVKDSRERRASPKEGEAAGEPDAARHGPWSPVEHPRGGEIDESLSLGDGDMTSTRFFSTAPPSPSQSSLVIEDWSVAEAEPSQRQLEHKGRLRRIALAVIAICAVGTAVAIGIQVSRSSSPEHSSHRGP